MVFFRNQTASKNINFGKVQRGLQYLAAKVYVTSPKSAEDVAEAFTKTDIMEQFGFTLHDDPDKSSFYKICFSSKEYSYCVFGSDKAIKMVKENIPDKFNRTILIDGTFSIVPIGCFKQLLLVHVEYCEMVCIHGITLQLTYLKS